LILNGLFALSTALTSAAAVQGAPSTAASPYVTELQRCQAVTDDAARLRCFDASVAQLLGASRAGQVSVIDQQQAREVRRSLFGFSVPKLAIFGGGDGEEAKELTAKVTRVRQSPDGRYTVQLEGGAWWETVQRPDTGEGPRIGGTVRLRKAALGSYFMNIDGNRAVRARRVE
jgi:hypothetical protein